MRLCGVALVTQLSCWVSLRDELMLLRSVSHPCIFGSLFTSLFLPAPGGLHGSVQRQLWPSVMSLEGLSVVSRHGAAPQG